MNVHILPKSYWRHKDKIYKVTRVSSGTDEIFLEDVESGAISKARYAIFLHAYERVLRVGEFAKLIDRSTRSIYRYEARGILEKPKCYKDKIGRMVRYYSKDDIEAAHELISLVHAGRPRKDKGVTNNTIMDIGNLKLRLREIYKWK